MIVDLKTAKGAELDAEIALIVKALPELETTPALKKVDDKRAFIARVYEEQGGNMPYELTEEYLANDVDGIFKDNVAGDIIWLPLPTVDEAPEVSSPSVEEAEEDEDGAPKPVIKFYKNEVVIDVRNVILNGRQYVDVFTNGASYRLTPEEFESEVKENE